MDNSIIVLDPFYLPFYLLFQVKGIAEIGDSAVLSTTCASERKESAMERLVRRAYYVCWGSGAVGTVTAIVGFALGMRIGHPFALVFGGVVAVSGLVLAVSTGIILLFPMMRRD